MRSAAGEVGVGEEIENHFGKRCRAPSPASLGPRCVGVCTLCMFVDSEATRKNAHRGSATQLWRGNHYLLRLSLSRWREPRFFFICRCRNRAANSPNARARTSSASFYWCNFDKLFRANGTWNAEESNFSSHHSVRHRYSLDDRSNVARENRKSAMK